ncbi:toxin RelE [Pelistega indica]|uniref:Toxin RelE n=1 Tax=Pelistega indica TaxID=1414851 RepID=V8G9D7_9BURK|nr:MULTISPECIES: type II toxin-antitoxin system HigB family toxin [Pelistega]ETD73010.1 toxin RelE [Pelistega indica]
MRVIAKRTLVHFWGLYKDAQRPLEAWHDIVLKVDWKSPQDVKATFANASICRHNRVVFNIAGNKYRLVVEIAYQIGVVWVKFIGTHKDYNEINVEEINEY